MILRLTQLALLLVAFISMTDSILTFNMYNEFLMDHSIWHAMDTKQMVFWVFMITMLIEYTVWAVSSRGMFWQIFTILPICFHPVILINILKSLIPWYHWTYIYLGVSAEMILFTIFVEMKSGRRFWNKWDDLIIVVFLVGTPELYNKAKAKILRA
ncbi:hypothetical protein KKA95_03580 [Patescibacteria group bacterium]|nr:hypothetical protein [Patescibacteria group bacterium]